MSITVVVEAGTVSVYGCPLAHSLVLDVPANLAVGRHEFRCRECDPVPHPVPRRGYKGRNIPRAAA